jgi:putative cardiolipin synthase
LLSDFSRVNRRMHNKSFTADNQATIVGGRNIGDEYFGAGSAVEFTDLDVLAVGAVVPSVSAEFDAYWNSASAYPAAALIRAAPPASAARARQAWATLHADPRATQYIEALRRTGLIGELLRGQLALEWAPARVIADDPAKVLHPPDRKELQMLPRLQAAIGEPERSLDLVSPYFVPTDDGTAALSALAAHGVQVRVLTNSLAATDVAPVHAGYAKYRKALLRGGIRLYELKPTAEKDERESPGGSDASLHAKTFAVDGARIFVGSFNFDPRSARLNTEMGVLIESRALASKLASTLDAALPRDAYEVRLGQDGELQWASEGQLFSAEPDTGFFRSLWIGFLSLLPIEWLL